ncbi:hypothetical protein BK124_01370 [Paenibacillus amylolyticus]|nr:hypothetical protein C170_20020 [Paenibacillus sp. FSL H7-689]OMF01354.1 hypothetical protein BK124_01370 [Paenibacillus amylolyticus]
MGLLFVYEGMNLTHDVAFRYNKEMKRILSLKKGGASTHEEKITCVYIFGIWILHCCLFLESIPRVKSAQNRKKTRK